MMVCVGLVVAGLSWAVYQSAQEDPALWKVDYYKPYDGWDLICDQYEGTENRRCYLRYVDTYSLDPFGAAVFFIEHEKNAGPNFLIDLEPGSELVSALLTQRDPTLSVNVETGDCDKAKCLLEDAAAAGFMFSGKEADKLRVQFVEKTELNVKLIWRCPCSHVQYWILKLNSKREIFSDLVVADYCLI
jgi:hypothetical protein